MWPTAPTADPWPPPQSSQVRAMYEEAGFEKRPYFRLVGKRSNWTSQEYKTAVGVRVTTNCRQRICVLGDSICRDLGARVKAALGPKCLWVLEVRVGQLASQHVAKLALHSSKGNSCDAYILCGLSLHWLFARESTNSHHDIAIFHDRPQEMADPVRDHAEYVSALLHNLSALAISWRPAPLPSPTSAHGPASAAPSPAASHNHSGGGRATRLLINDSTPALKPALAPPALKPPAPLILVGSGELDALTILSRPSKRDWQDYHQFGLLSLWRHAECEIFARGIQERSTAGGTATSVTTATWASHGITYMDTQEVYARYPGIRCDGVHFASDFARYAGEPPAADLPHACHSSVAVWDWYLLRALEAAGLYERVAPDHWRERGAGHEQRS